MNNSPLDEHIKKQFGNFTPDVPAHIWENIVAEKDKRKPFGFWLNYLNRHSVILIAGTVLLATTTILIKNYYTTEVNSRKRATRETGFSSTTHSNSIPSITNNPAVQANNAAAEIRSEKTTIGVKEQQTGTNIKKEGNDKHTFATENQPSGTKDVFNSLPPAISVNDHPTAATATVSGKSKTFKGKTRMVVSNANPDLDEYAAGPKGTNEMDRVFLLNPVLLYPDQLQASALSALAIKKPVKPFLEIPCPESEKDAAGNKRYFEIYGGPDYAFRNLTDTGNSAYLQKRKESTRFSSAFSVGLRYTKVFNNGMSFRTGINYSQINEKFRYAEGNIIQVIYIVNGNGDTTGSFTSTGTRYKTTFNTFKTIDIPLVIGYEIGNGRLHANLNAGAMINVYSWQKGDVLDTTYKPVSITTGNQTSPYQFKSNVGIGFIGSVSVYYKLNKRFHLMAEPYFRYNFSAASKADLTLKQKYNTAGLRLGIRMDF